MRRLALATTNSYLMPDLNNGRRSTDVEIACCGLFHYRNYVESLSRKGRLSKFVFSHRIGTLRGKNWAKNIWLKEYLFWVVQRYFPPTSHGKMISILHDYWDIRAAQHVGRAAILHVMLHGNSRRVIEKGVAAGSVILGEAVNTHPENYFAVNQKERQVCGLSHPGEMSGALLRLQNEILHCNWLLTPSQQVSKSFIERGFPEHRVKCIPFGAEPNDFSPPADWSHREGPELIVVCVAQVIPRKGIHYLIEAWRMLGMEPEKARLRICGYFAAEMKNVFDPIPRGVEFLGSIEKPRIIAELRSASVFVLPTLEEGFAISISEAMATGCVVITTPESGASEIIENGVNGFIIPSRSPVSIAEQLRKLFKEPATRTRIGRLASAKVTKELNWTAYEEKLNLFYEQIASMGK